ncbi:MAG: leucine-rich repeat domain-containing protein [bacterium]
MGDHAFYDCDALANVTLNEGLKAIDHRAFADLPALTAIESESFADGAFQYVIVPPAVTSIGSKAFANCADLIYIRIPASIRSIAADAFEGCNDQLIIDRLN